MSAAFRVAFNEAVKTTQASITVVAHLDDELDPVGHSFIILDNGNG